MKTESDGYKPLTTGRFKTRQGLIGEVIRKAYRTKLSQDQIAERCDVSKYTVHLILKEHKIEIDRGAGI